jgi:hypothetical protein
MNKEALTGINLPSSTRSVALAWMLEVPDAGADCMFSFEDKDLPERPDVGISHRRSDAGSNLNDTTGSHAGKVNFGMTSMRPLPKGAFGVEMHLIP